MSKHPVYWHKAKKILSRRDPVLRKIIKKYNKGFLTTRGNPFFFLMSYGNWTTNFDQSC